MAIHRQLGGPDLREATLVTRSSCPPPNRVSVMIRSCVLVRRDCRARPCTHGAGLRDESYLNPRLDLALNCDSNDIVRSRYCDESEGRGQALEETHAFFLRGLLCTDKGAKVAEGRR